MPFNMNTFSKMWGISKPEEGESHYRGAEKAVPGEPENLEEQAIKLVGTDIYKKLVKGYTEKQWDVIAGSFPPSLSAVCRCVLPMITIILTILIRGIPKDGYNAIIEKLLRVAKSGPEQTIWRTGKITTG